MCSCRSSYGGIKYQRWSICQVSPYASRDNVGHQPIKHVLNCAATLDLWIGDHPNFESTFMVSGGGVGWFVGFLGLRGLGFLGFLFSWFGDFCVVVCLFRFFCFNLNWMLSAILEGSNIVWRWFFSVILILFFLFLGKWPNKRGLECG